jgi:hypothetical protein
MKLASVLGWALHASCWIPLYAASFVAISLHSFFNNYRLPLLFSFIPFPLWSIIHHHLCYGTQMTTMSVCMIGILCFMASMSLPSVTASSSSTNGLPYAVTQGYSVYSSTDRVIIGAIPECINVFNVLAAGQVHHALSFTHLCV